LVRQSDQAKSLVHILLRSCPPAFRPRLRRCGLLHLQFRTASAEPTGCDGPSEWGWDAFTESSASRWCSRLGRGSAWGRPCWRWRRPTETATKYAGIQMILGFRDRGIGIPRVWSGVANELLGSIYDLTGVFMIGLPGVSWTYATIGIGWRQVGSGI